MINHEVMPIVIMLIMVVVIMVVVMIDDDGSDDVQCWPAKRGLIIRFNYFIVSISPNLARSKSQYISNNSIASTR